MAFGRYFQVTAEDSRGQVIGSTLAHGALSHAAGYVPATGQMQALSVTGMGSGAALQALSYGYDDFGNLASQETTHAGGVSSETFLYDALQRLVQSSRNLPGGNEVINYGYDAAGNLTLKDDYASALYYADARPDAVSSLTKIGGGTVNFEYDASGNQLSGDGRTLSYSAFSQPRSIAAGGVTATFAYGAELARYRQDKNTGESTLYIDKLMEVVEAGGGVEYRHYLGEVALLTKSGDLNDPAPVVRLLLRDRLGSVVSVTEDAGLVEGRGYDPFGKPREPDWADKVPPVLESAVTLRGFTAHEHLDESELIHMNGRVYDYRVGRFLSVDPIIQAPGNSQGLNPYAYLMNNPLAGTDPSGYCSTREGDQKCVLLTGSHIPRDVKALNNVGGQVTVGGMKLVTTVGSRDNGARASAGPALTADGASNTGGNSTADINGLGAQADEADGGRFRNGAMTGAFAYLFNDAAHQVGRNQEVPVPEEVKEAVEKTFELRFRGAFDVGEIKVIANSSRTNLFSSITELRTRGLEWNPATTGKNTIYLNSRYTPETFFSDTPVILEEYYHVIRQWNTEALTGSRFLANPDRWENPARDFARDYSKVYDYFRNR